MRNRLVAMVAAAALMCGLGVSTARPALADFNYTSYGPLMGMFPTPDICSFGNCIYLGALRTQLNTYSQIMNQIQQAQMSVQNLKSGPLGRLGGMGVGDPVSGNLLQSILQRVGGARTTNASTACQATVSGAGAGNRVDLMSLFGVQQGSGVGNLASGQITSVVLQKVAGEIEAQNQCKAAEAVQTQANVQKAYYNGYDEMDLNGAPDAGWMLN